MNRFCGCTVRRLAFRFPRVNKKRTHRKVCAFFIDPYRNLPRPKKCPPDTFLPSLRSGRPFDFRTDTKNSSPNGEEFFGDPYGNRTHVTAVKGRCLNRLTNGPGSGDLTRTGDRPGMNRVLYQLSYAAIGPASLAFAKSASLLYLLVCRLSRHLCVFFQNKLEILTMRCGK